MRPVTPCPTRFPARPGEAVPFVGMDLPDNAWLLPYKAVVSEVSEVRFHDIEGALARRTRCTVDTSPRTVGQ
jgi:hypothetical protein